MKYMHFNSACSYAGLANQLELEGIQAEDTEIVMKIGLPYCIDYQEENPAYLTGAMLQGKQWFDRYLTTCQKEYQEEFISAHKLPQELKVGMMFGLQTASGQKHAVVYLGKTEDGRYCLLNNKWEHSEEPEQLYISEAELLERVPEQVVLGFLKDKSSETVSLINGQSTALLWEQYRKDIMAYAEQKHTPKELWESRNPLFRPLLVDTLAMMQVIGKEDMTKKLKVLQGQYLSAIKKEKELVLAEELDLQLVEEATEYLSEQAKKL